MDRAKANGQLRLRISREFEIAAKRSGGTPQERRALDLRVFVYRLVFY